MAKHRHYGLHKERRVRSVTVRLDGRGMTSGEAADHLEQIADLIRAGYVCGHVRPGRAPGWWEVFDTREAAAAGAAS